ncbi:MAG TPA: endolytic transglycosylase MltG [Azospirillaceae bacterium]|nr:endolytic transglycosylase MltG [Azospirillaceae bacterium]
MRLALRIAAVLLVVAALLGAGGWYWAKARFEGPGPLAADTTVVVDKGAGVPAIAARLAEAGVVRGAREFQVAARLTDSGRLLKAGEYAVPAAISLRDLLELLKSGRTVVRRLTVPEGLTSTQILALVNAETALSGDPGPVPPEGTLLPETYHFSLGDPRAEIVARMRAGMIAALAELWAARAPDLPVSTPEEAVTLASIVEKETGLPAERPRVAGVFVNRLRLGMKLQSDPTTIYAVTGGKGPLDRPLSRADLRTESPYNTYFADGLPPGPIANPGRASLAATLNPERHEFLYFVADGTGGHAFAATLDEHNRNVAKWRQIERERGAAEPAAEEAK